MESIGQLLAAEGAQVASDAVAPGLLLLGGLSYSCLVSLLGETVLTWVLGETWVDQISPNRRSSIVLRFWYIIRT